MNDYIEFQIERSNNASQPYYFVIKTRSNHKVLASSETYANKADCKRAIELIRAFGATGAVWDMTVTPLEWIA